MLYLRRCLAVFWYFWNRSVPRRPLGFSCMSFIFRSVRTAQPLSWSTGQRLCTSQRPGSTPPVLGGRLFRVAAWWLHTLLMPALLLVFGVLWHTCMFCAVWSTTRLELGPHTLALMSSRRSSSAFRGLAHHVWLVVTFLDSHVLPRAGWGGGH